MTRQLNNDNHRHKNKGNGTRCRYSWPKLQRQSAYGSDQPQGDKTRPLASPLIRCALSETCCTSHKKANQLQQPNKAKQGVCSSCSNAKKHLRSSMELIFIRKLNSNGLLSLAPEQVNMRRSDFSQFARILFRLFSRSVTIRFRSTTTPSLSSRSMVGRVSTPSSSAKRPSSPPGS